MPADMTRQKTVRVHGLAVLFALVFAGSLAAADDVAARRSKIANLPPAEQQELLRKQERFEALPPEERERLRALQAAIDADPEADHLHQVLARYHEWLKTLTPSQRTKLADLPPKERVQEIKRMQQQQQAARDRTHRAELLSRRDIHEVVRWTEDFVWKHRKVLVAEMSKEQRARFENWELQRQRRELFYRAVERARREGGGGALTSVEQADIDRLSERLSEPAKKELADASTLAAQRKVVRDWIGTAMHRLEPWQTPRRVNALVGEDLLQFLQNDVPPPQRERLLKMPPDEMRQELRGMYFERGRPDRPGPDGPGARWLEGPGSERPKGGFRGKAARLPGPPPKESAEEGSRASDASKADPPAKDETQAPH